MPALEVALMVRRPPEKIATEDLIFEASVVNRGDAPVRFNVFQAEHPSLVLEVEDSYGQRVLLPPPPPPTEEQMAPGEELGPDASIVLRYQGFLDPSVGPGRFRVRYVGRSPSVGGVPDDPLISEWVEFDLPSPPRPRPKRWPPWGLWDLRMWWRRLIVLIREWLFACRRVWEQEVDEARTETISNAPPPFAASNGTYGWRARFHLRIEEATCRAHVTVRIRVTGTISTAQQTAWETAIENRWSNVFKICSGARCCLNGFTIDAHVQFVASGEHQVVVAGTSTTSMTNWSATTTFDIPHEFGHMLGALDEYFTVNGTNWGAQSQPTGSIMNNSAKPPAARHYELVRRTAETLMGAVSTTRATADPC